MAEKIYIPLLVFGALLGATYYLLGIGALTSNIFMLAIYALFVPCLFFTYGAFIEKEIVRKQVIRLVDDVTQSAKNLNYNIPDVKIPVNDSLDKSVKDNNNKLIKEAFLYLSVGFVGGIALTIALWYYSKKSFNYKHMAYENLVLLLLVAITEIAFFGVISRNYRTLDSNKIKQFVLKELAKKLK
jgi:hypothetical protein